MIREISVAPNVTERHTRACRLSAGGRQCTCNPSYLAIVSVGGRGERRKYRRTFKTLPDATAWAFEIRRAVLVARARGRNEHEVVNTLIGASQGDNP